ncbi:hypothetical protein M8756_17655 [Lutimaribacter sp. EGI FJ00015]|uniref:Uncharacterized protein n=1 Tax=Lutimaribacter degradans TaxID=2945989 RepID=A0ACC6A0P6_9RHOB|nr:hypothetical protein [Lutimaribacter sp. EGI FJ00013]MCM2563926.1 hypothetical protein [Lutimaribacter sp. EGI FJ00013]MCO0615136.1 hypothetical protein [Lutimaribacter sp. EGI FJ00015]MCO0637761.1 hypothetical protein [Lutimaribacter sp. EGI FJ00014]
MTGPNGKMIGGMADMRIAGAWVDDLGLTPDEVVQIVSDTMARNPDSNTSTAP